MDNPDYDINLAKDTHASLWWKDTPTVDGERVGCIGQFAAANPESAADLIEASLDRLREENCSLAIGPMDGNTWRSYRFVTGGTDAPPFFLEPQNPAFFPEAFQNAGFEPLARYSSSIIKFTDAPPRSLDRIEERLTRQGVQIRPIQPDRFLEELDRLYEMSLEGFRENFLYTPISRDGFLALYEKIQPLVVPDFVLIAEAEGNPVSFVFAIPDFAEAARERGKTGGEKTLIVKTLVTLPSWRHLGVGSVLVERVQTAAREAGFTRAIHALQHQSNSSLKITRRNRGATLREYTLFSRRLK